MGSQRNLTWFDLHISRIYPTNSNNPQKTQAKTSCNILTSSRFFGITHPILQRKILNTRISKMTLILAINFASNFNAQLTWRSHESCKHFWVNLKSQKTPIPTEALNTRDQQDNTSDLSFWFGFCPCLIWWSCEGCRHCVEEKPENSKPDRSFGSLKTKGSTRWQYWLNKILQILPPFDLMILWELQTLCERKSQKTQKPTEALESLEPKGSTRWHWLLGEFCFKILSPFDLTNLQKLQTLLCVRKSQKTLNLTKALEFLNTRDQQDDAVA